MIHEDLKIRMEHAQERLRTRLVANVPFHPNILRGYTAAIESNFIAMLSMGVLSARSLQGRFAAEENLEVELREDHPYMLRQFARSAKAEPMPTDYAEVEPAVLNLKGHSMRNGLSVLTILGTLEYTSAVFIPYLRTCAESCGTRDFTYVNVHGSADIKHADQFVWAIAHEAKQYDHALLTINEAMDATHDFLIKIL